MSRVDKLIRWITIVSTVVVFIERVSMYITKAKVIYNKRRRKVAFGFGQAKPSSPLEMRIANLRKLPESKQTRTWP